MKRTNFFLLFFHFKVSGGWFSKLVCASCGNWNAVSFPCFCSGAALAYFQFLVLACNALPLLKNGLFEIVLKDLTMIK